MKQLILGVTALALLAPASGAFAQSAPLSPAKAAKSSVKPAVTGDYLESRSLSVYAGACHYGGEAVTEGKEAILAWRIKAGVWNGQALNGLSAVAVVNGPENLAFRPDGHRTVIYVEESATPAQRDALAGLLTQSYGNFLGEVTAVKPAPVKFTVKDRNYRVQVPGAAYIAADKYPCHKCVMPHQVWYTPFVPVKDAMVARALRTEFKGNEPTFTKWTKDVANSAYIGEFAL
ncbi:MAG: DUF1326 domain-containing protein [Armatimonadetes bacterium]|nr:DUF1326 domain-containing protein [Armatimonadota bacterium]